MPFEPTAQAERHRDEIVRLILDSQAKRGYAPSFRELAAALGLSVPAVAHHLRTLYWQGTVVWDHGVARSLRVLALRDPARPYEPLQVTADRKLAREWAERHEAGG